MPVKYATKPQARFIDGLLIDVGLSNLKPRNDYLSRIADRQIEHIADLTASEASEVIEELLELKESRQG